MQAFAVGSSAAFPRLISWPVPMFQRLGSAVVIKYLGTCIPDIWVGCHPRTVWAHVCLHNVLNHQALLKNGPIEHLPLHCQLDLQTPGMRLCPDESRIHKLHLLQASNAEHHEWWEKLADAFNALRAR